MEKFWLPIVDESVFYNPFNTALYSVLFAVAAAYIGFPTLKNLDIKLDRAFFTGIAPFVFLGGSMRSLKDVDAMNTILLETPLIYLLMFCIIVVSIAVSRKAASLTGKDYQYFLLGIGSVILLLTLPFYSINNMAGFMMIIGTTVSWITVFYIALRALKPELLEPDFYIPVGAHYMDAAVTSVALLFPGTAEKHVLARFFINLMGPFAGMFVMKSLMIVPAVYYIRRDEEGERKRYYLFLVTLLGFAIATRNLLSFITLS